MKADVVVIGAGHNGMVAAALLARAGRRVIVCDALEEVGGLSSFIPIHPGFKAPLAHLDTSSFHPDLVALLDLDRHGLEWADPVPIHCLGPDHPPFELRMDAESGPAALETLSRPDADAFEKTARFIRTIKRVVNETLATPPPPLAMASLGDFMALGSRGLALRLLGRRDMYELLRILPMCAADWLRERFETPALIEALAAEGMHRSFAGPWSAWTCALLLMKWCQTGNPVKGGAPALIDALHRAARAAGADFRMGAPVRRIVLHDDAVAGVRLDDGERIEAPAVLATIHPREVMTRLLPPDGAPPGLVRRMGAFRSRGITALIHFALDGDIDLKDAPGVHARRLRIGLGDVDRLEQCFDAAKYGQIPERVHLEVAIPSREHDELAPDGGHVLSAWIGFVPPLDPRRPDSKNEGHEGNETAIQDEVLEKVRALLDRHITGFRSRVRDHVLLMPRDIEAAAHVPGGHLFHGEHAADQLYFMRPSFDCARYETPVRGLFLGGSGTHPGGGLSGLPGLLAANALLGADDEAR